MASVGHLAVGAAAARVARLRRGGARATIGGVLFWSALSFLPDADVIGFALGVRYEDAWGHRGATHSLLFSLALGLLVGMAAPRFGRPAVRTGLLAAVVLASHALLDTLTDGGLGCALFWPFDLTRYFAPWRPIPVAPIGLGYLSPYGMYVASVELLFFAPVFWLMLPRHSAARRARPIAVLFGLWLFGLWVLLADDPIRERLFRALMRDSTEFAAGYSESRLNAVSVGDTPDDVRRGLGAPLFEVPYRSAGGACWMYSRSPDNGYYRARAVCFENGRVVMVARRWIRN